MWWECVKWSGHHVAASSLRRSVISVLLGWSVVLSLLAHHSWLDECDELIQNGEDLWLVHEVGQVGVLLLVVVEVLLVVHLLVLLLPHFFDLVVVDVQLLSIEILLVKLGFGLGSCLWGSEADKCVDCLSFLGEDPDAFYNSKPLKYLFQLIVGSGRREVFDVEVASLL